jgi:histidinol-phosphate aminotransferase
VDPTFGSVYQFATNSKAEALKVPLLEDYRMDIPGIIRAVKNNYRDVGFVYVCNPNNPTGNIIPKQEIKLLLDGIPGDVPVLIDEVYHHFVEDPNYATSVPYLLEGRQVIVTRTFSKIAALAGMRLGYGLAPKELIARMSPFANGSINAIVKWGGVAALKDRDTDPDQEEHPGAAQESDRRIDRPGLQRHPVGSEFLHGPCPPGYHAHHRRIREKGCPGRAQVPADGRAPARIGRNPG